MKRRRHHSTSVSEQAGGEDYSERSDIEIGIVRRGEVEPYEVMVKQVPKDLPAEFRKLLSEFYCEGFQDGVIFTEHPKLRIPRRKGRPSKLIAKDLGKEAARLNKEKGLSFGQIAPRLCEKKNEPRHVCDKKCADRMRQRAKPFLKRPSDPQEK